MSTTAGAPAGPSVVAFLDIAKLPDKNIDANAIKFANVSLGSEKFVAVKDDKSVAVIDLTSKASPSRLNLVVDSVAMNPTSKMVALRVGNNITIFSVEANAKIKQSTLAEQIVFWKWIDAKTVAIVGTDNVYHWSLEGSNDPSVVFQRAANDQPVQVINYSASADGKFLMVNGLSADPVDRSINGVLQVYSVAQSASQPTVNAPAACFANVLLDGRDQPSNIFCFARKDPATKSFSLQMVEVGAPKDQVFVKQAPMRFQDGDFPMAMLCDPKMSVLYVLSQQGFIFAYEIQSGKPIYAQRASSVSMFASCVHSEDGIITLDQKGRVAQFFVDRKNAVPYICNTMKDMELGVQMARRYNLEGADHIFKAQFSSLMGSNRVQEAVELAMSSPQLRTVDTINALRNAGGQYMLQYFTGLLNKSSLNGPESVELSKLLIQKGQPGIENIKNFVKENKFEASEELGELFRVTDLSLALSIFVRAKAHIKAVGCFLQLGAMEQDDTKARQFFATALEYVKANPSPAPDFNALTQALIRANRDRAREFALMLLNHEDGPKLNIDQISEAFFQQKDIKNGTNILLEYLRPRGDRAEDAALQTKLLRYNIMFAAPIAKAIMESNDFKMTHFNKVEIASLCERAGLYRNALELYTDANDVKRIILSATTAPDMDMPFLVNYFENLTPQLGLEIMRDLLRSAGQNQQNLPLVVEICKKWTEHFGTDKIISMFEESKNVVGLFHFLSSFVNHTSNPAVVMKFIEVASKAGSAGINEIRNVCRDNNHYDPREVKEYLIQQPFSVQDPRPLIHVCERFNYLEDLITFLFNHQKEQFITAFVQRQSPKSAPQVVGILLDLNASEEQIKELLKGTRAPENEPNWVNDLTDVCERRSRLRILRPWLEERVKEESKDPQVYTALAKLYIDGGNNPRHFLETNSLYDPIAVGKFCESRDPPLAVVVYRKGQCDEELIDVTNKNGFFKDQARYLVERQDIDVWAKVLVPENPYRRSLIDQVVAVALPESHNPEHVSWTVKAFIAADLPNELIELLERLMLRNGENSHFHDNKNLQNLLIITAIKADKTRVMEYLKRLDNYDVSKITSTCLLDEHKLYEEAFYVFKKVQKFSDAARVLIDNIGDLKRAFDFASTSANIPEVWSLLADAQLRNNDLKDAIVSFIKAEDATRFMEVIGAITNSNDDELYHDLISYLKMARTKSKDSMIDNELVYSFARINDLVKLEEFVQGTNNARLLDCGDRILREERYAAGKIIFTQISNWAKLSMCLVKLQQWHEAVEAARKAKSVTTWKFVCFACVDAQEFQHAQICGLQIINMMEHLVDLVQHYENLGYFTQLITLLEAGIVGERTHQGIFTELGIAYAKYDEAKLLDYIKLNHSRANTAKLITACRQNQLWVEAVFLCQQNEYYEQAVEIMMEHSTQAWIHNQFKEYLLKCGNNDLVYRAIDFYVEEHPLLLNDLLQDMEKKLDHTRVVFKLRKLLDNNLSLVQSYLLRVQYNDIIAVNDAINELAILEENHQALRTSIESYKNIDQHQLANQLQNHELLEFRRIAAKLYRLNGNYERSMSLSKKDQLWQDSMDTVAASKDAKLAEELLRFFVSEKLPQCFSAMLFTCFDLITPDVVLELAWRHNLTNFAMPYMIQTFSNYNKRLAVLEQRWEEHSAEKKEEEKAKAENGGVDPNAVAMMNMQAANAPLMITMVPQVPMGMQGMNPMGMNGMGQGGFGGMY